MAALDQLISIKDLTPASVHEVLLGAKLFSKNIHSPLLSNQTIALLFFENSTRTKISFELAIKKLSGSSVYFSSSGSSMSKGETVLDTTQTIRAMGVNGFIVRHQTAGVPLSIKLSLNLPVINAGDGTHEHPTQALLDIFTLIEHFKDIKNKKILILGDTNQRVARSNIKLLKMLGAEVILCGPHTLINKNFLSLGVKIETDLDQIIGSVDAIMALRIQTERQNSMQIPNVNEFRKFWGVTASRLKSIKKDTVILHPGPTNWGVELDYEVSDDSRSLISKQVQNGLFVRMSVLSKIFNPNGFKDFLENKGKQL